MRCSSPRFKDSSLRALLLIRPQLSFGVSSVDGTTSLSTEHDSPIAVHRPRWARTRAHRMRVAWPPRRPAGRTSGLYFGRNIGDTAVVSDSAWQLFVRETVTPAFPEGSTVWEAAGRRLAGLSWGVQQAHTVACREPVTGNTHRVSFRDDARGDDRHAWRALHNRLLVSLSPVSPVTQPIDDRRGR